MVEKKEHNIYISHFYEENLVYILIKKYKCVSFEVHYNALTLKRVKCMMS